MKDIITIEEKKDTQTPTGFVRSEWVQVLNCKACKKKQSVAPGNEMNASEVFIDKTVVFQTYRYPSIKEGQRIRWNSSLYTIVLLDPQTVDNTYLITCKKEDE